MRGYKQQFEPEIAAQIEKLINRVESLRYPTGPARYYGFDLSMCLSAGALAGSLIVASSLLEIYIRGLVVRYVENAQSGWSNKVSAELELEEMRREDIYRLLDHLVTSDLFNGEDAQIAKKLYKEIRIPTHHGLPSRLLRKNKDDPFHAIFSLLGRTEVSLSEFERFVEYESIPILEEIIGVIERNQVKEYV